MNIRNSITSLFMGIALAGCSKKEFSTNLSKPYVGTWKITRVVNDGGLQSAWSGLILSIHQTHEPSGTYELRESPYDSVWYPEGI